MGDSLDYVHTHEVFVFADDRPKVRWVCDGCGAWTPMDVWKDSRSIEKTRLDDGRTMLTDVSIPADADPPPYPTLYVCPKCNHAHEGQPSLKNPT